MSQTKVMYAWSHRPHSAWYHRVADVLMTPRGKAFTLGCGRTVRQVTVGVGQRSLPAKVKRRGLCPGCARMTNKDRGT